MALDPDINQVPYRLPVLSNAKLGIKLLVASLHCLDLFKGQPVPRSIINPSCRRDGMGGDPLRDLDGAARTHVFGDASRTEAVTTNSFQEPTCPRPFLDQLHDTSDIQASLFNPRTETERGNSPPFAVLNS
jgi:hypothetical protein